MRKYKSLPNDEINKTILTMPYEIKYIPTILESINEIILCENHIDFNIEELKKIIEDEVLNIILSKEESLNKESIDIRLDCYKSNLKITIINSYNKKIVIDSRCLEKKSNIQHNNKTPYTIRPIAQREVFEISKSIYKTYEDTYVYKALYNPNILMNLNKCEKLLSYAAINPEGKIISHTALKIDNKLGELTAAFTEREYRGMNCVENLSYSIIEEAKLRNLEGVFLNAVCTHKFSQKVSCKIGLKPCALMLSALNHIRFRGIEENEKLRESLLVCFKYLKAPEILNLYVPKKHRSIVSDIYDELGIELNILKGNRNIKYENHDVNVNITENNSCYVYINKFGIDTVRKINRLLFAEVSALYIFMDMSNPLIDIMCSEFEEVGFVFCGVMPGVERNNLILQYIHDNSLKYDQLDLNSVLAKKILNYIKQSIDNYKKKIKKIDL